MVTNALRTTLINTIALALIALPVGVFAQTETPNESPVVETSADATGAAEATTTSETSTEASSQTQEIYDNYIRSKIPGGANYKDFVVGPGFFTLEVAPGDSVTVPLNVSNRMGATKLFKLTTEDMTGTNESSGVKLLGDEVGPYTIKDYITVPYDRFYLDNNTRATIPVTVSIPDDAEPGGFYGSILTEIATTPDKEGTGVAPGTSIVSRIGTLFFVTTPGGIEKNGELTDFSTVPKKTFYGEGPIDMGITFENLGNVHFTPYADVSVTNILGEQVGEVKIEPWYVMPKSVRTKELSWDRELLIGRYVITADVNLGFEDVTETKQLVVWVLPWKILLPVFIGLFLVSLFFRFIFRNFEFKRK